MNKFFSLFQRAAQPPRLYQLHEHLALMDTGVNAMELTPELREACLQAAQAIWPATGLSAWDAFERKAGYCYACGDGVHGYLHVDADHANCFVIILFERKQSRPIGWLLFDIGGEYQDSIFICPGIGHEDVPTPELIEEGIRTLDESADSFAVLERNGGTYMQAFREGENAYVLEHQLVTTACHYRAVGPLDAARVIWAFKSYAFEKKEWAREMAWEKMEL